MSNEGKKTENNKTKTEKNKETSQKNLWLFLESHPIPCLVHNRGEHHFVGVSEC